MDPRTADRANPGGPKLYPLPPAVIPAPETPNNGEALKQWITTQLAMADVVSVEIFVAPGAGGGNTLHGVAWKRSTV